MAIKQSDWAKGTISAPYPSEAGAVVACRFTYAVPADIAANDIIELAPIPPHCRVLDMVLDSDGLDTDDTQTIAIDVGVMSGDWQSESTSRTCGDEFFDGDTTAQDGGVARPTLATAFRVSPSDTARSIGIKIATAAATGKAGTIGLTVTYATQ